MIILSMAIARKISAMVKRSYKCMQRRQKIISSIRARSRHDATPRLQQSAEDVALIKSEGHILLSALANPSPTVGRRIQASR